MATDVFRRVLWKEYRMLRGFWVALVLIAAAIQFLVWVFSDAIDVNNSFVAVAVAIVVMYSLGVGATIFAVEREEGTDAFLELLPVESRQLFRAKVTLAVGSVVAFAAALVAITWAWTWSGTDSPLIVVHGSLAEIAANFAMVAVVVLDAFLWCLCFSLLLRRPLVAACVGGVAALATLPGALFGTATAELFGVVRPLDGAAPWYVFAAMLAVVFAFDVWLGRRWLDGLSITRLRRQRRRMRAATSTAVFADSATREPSSIAAFSRLTWQELRQVWRMMATFIGVTSLFAIVVAGRRDAVGVVATILVGMVAIMGACAFRMDQERGQFRFFAERPVSPRLVWLNRHVVWMSVIAAWLLIAVPIWVFCVYENLKLLLECHHLQNVYGPGSLSFAGSLTEMPFWGVLTLFILIAYACGQLCSMLFRSSIIAGFASVILTGAVSAWAGLMAIAGVSWLLSTAPIPAFLLFVTWLRAPHWIAERTDWRAQTRLGLSLAMPALALGVATATFRVLQIPLVEPGFSPTQYQAEVTPAARETADMYLRAGDMLSAAPVERPKNESNTDENVGAGGIAVTPGGTLPSESDFEEEQSAWLAHNRDALELALSATRRPTCIFPLITGPRNDRVLSLARLIELEARRLAADGDLDEALERELDLLRMSSHLRNHQYYLGPGHLLEQKAMKSLRTWWALLPGQTPARIRHAIAAVDEWEKATTSPADTIEENYLRVERLLALDDNALADLAREDKNFAAEFKRYVVMAKLMPWELARARRGLSYLTSHDLTHLRQIEGEIAAHADTSRTLHNMNRWNNDGLLETTFLLHAFGPFSYATHFWVYDVTNRRATRLVMALIAWRLEHGELPATLDELVGPYFAELPRDPYSGKSFAYFPNGVAEESPLTMLDDTKSTPAGVPFIWSCGPLLALTGTNGDGDDLFIQIPGNTGQIGSPAAAPEVLKLGRSLLIPTQQAPDEP